MKIWQLTDTDFHGTLFPTPGPDTQLADLRSSDLAALLAAVSAEPRQPLPHAAGYTYGLTSGLPLDQAAMVVFDPTDAPIAGKIGPTIMVNHAHRRRGVGPGMIVALYETYQWPPGMAFDVSDLGARAMRRAHAVEVAKAYIAGEPIPAQVLAIYNLP